MSSGEDSPVRGGKKRRREMVDDDDEEDGDTIYCVCKSTDVSRFMIGCEHCEDWFHGDCVDVTEKMARHIKRYYCPECVKKNPGVKIVYKSSYLERLKEKEKKEKRREDKGRDRDGEGPSSARHKEHKSDRDRDRDKDRERERRKEKEREERRREKDREREREKERQRRKEREREERRQREKEKEKLEAEKRRREEKELLRQRKAAIEEARKAKEAEEAAAKRAREEAEAAKQSSSSSLGVTASSRRDFSEDSSEEEEEAPPQRAQKPPPKVTAKKKSVLRELNYSEDEEEKDDVDFNAGDEEEEEEEEEVWEPPVVKKPKEKPTGKKRSKGAATSSKSSKRRRKGGYNSSSESDSDFPGSLPPGAHNPEIDRPMQCQQPDCVNPARLGVSKYCSDECGMKLAIMRLKAILPKRISQWQTRIDPKYPCLADKRDALELQGIMDKQKNIQKRMQELNEEFDRLEELITEGRSQSLAPEDSDDEGEAGGGGGGEGEAMTVHCVTCGASVQTETAVRHMQRCYNKVESQTSFASKYPTQISDRRLFCDFYNPKEQSYCKRLKVLCPEHSPDPKIGDDDVCGYPVTPDLFAPPTSFCRRRKKTCHLHHNWEKLRRAHLDMERVRIWMKVDELLEQQRQLQASRASRAGVLALMLHETIDHDMEHKWRQYNLQREQQQRMMQQQQQQQQKRSSSQKNVS